MNQIEQIKQILTTANEETIKRVAEILEIKPKPKFEVGDRVLYTFNHTQKHFETSPYIIKYIGDRKNAPNRTAKYFNQSNYCYVGVDEMYGSIESLGENYRLIPYTEADLKHFEGLPCPMGGRTPYMIKLDEDSKGFFVYWYAKEEWFNRTPAFPTVHEAIRCFIRLYLYAIEHNLYGITADMLKPLTEVK